MRRLIPSIVAALGLVLTMGGTATAATATAATPAPVLTAIRAAHHPGFDRLVFQFREECQRSARLPTLST